MSKPKGPADREPAKEAEATADEAAEDKAKIDISSLDLRLEKVEERISPSETNVFDK